jgi:anti-sigma factor RsiW
MNITRHNYEEYFILYMDNELAPAERGMVEDFVQLHPDLKEELDLLLQYKLTPDTDIVFAGKEELLKGQEASIVNLSNYEEYLLLYTDNELNPAQKAAVEQFAAENLAVQKELDLLRFTRLQPESVEFPDKASLYRQEEKVRALPVRWWRAAAAILILGLALTALWYTNNKPATDSVAVEKTMDGIKSPAPVLNPEEETGVAALQGKDTPEAGADTATIQAVAENGFKTNTNQVQRDQSPAIKNKLIDPAPVNNNALATQQPNDKPSNNLPQPAYNPNVIKPNDAIAYNPAPEKNTIPEKTLTNTVVTNPDIAPSDITNASFKEENGGKKNKLRGFFRKVTRTFEKRTNIDPTDQDNRLLVGGLSIKLK